MGGTSTLLGLDDVVVVVVVLYCHEYDSISYAWRTYVVGPSYIGGTSILLELDVVEVVVAVLKTASVRFCLY